MAKEIIAVDLGGTQIRAARLDQALTLLQRENTLTRAEQGPEFVINRIKTYIRKVMPKRQADILGIGISAPGPLNPLSGVMIAPPNLPGWLDIPLRDMIAAEFGLPVYLGNDANVAALAEACKGAAQGCRHVVYFTVSTGIGSGVISDGKLLLGHAGLAAELGHIPIVMESGQVSTVEPEAAGPAIAGRLKAAIQAGAKSSALDLVRGDLNRIDAKTVGLAAAAGDELAIECLAYAGRILGLGIVCALLAFNPEIIVLGGGVTKTGDLLLRPMKEAIHRHILNDSFTADLRIELAALGDDVALVGAAALAATDGGNVDISELDRRF